MVLQKDLLQGSGIEIGSGSGAFSIIASKEKSVAHITCVDRSLERLEESQDFFLPRLNGQKEKISFLCSDFHRLPFADETLDFVVADAALHHTKDLRTLLLEIRRVLKPSGVVIAVREPILPEFPVLQRWRKLTFGWKQRLQGHTEQPHSRAEWNEEFAHAGFLLTLAPYTIGTTTKERLLHRLSKFNGILFNRHILIASRI